MADGCNAELEHCPHCRVQRAKLAPGRWCTTCGYSPGYEERIATAERELERLRAENEKHERFHEVYLHEMAQYEERATTAEGRLDRVFTALVDEAASRHLIGTTDSDTCRTHGICMRVRELRAFLSQPESEDA